MLLTLLKRAVKAALHQATDEWALECGLPRATVETLRSRREALIIASEQRADADAAAALGVDDDDYLDDDYPTRPALLMAGVAQITTEVENACPPPGDEAALMAWVRSQRSERVGWADIAKTA